MTLTQEIKSKAIELGFDLVGVTDARQIDERHADAMRDFLDAGFAGEMSYLHRNFEKRINPSVLFPGARSVIVAAINFNRPDTVMPKKPAGRVALYARYEDYHFFIKKLLRKLALFIDGIADGDFKFKICVDSVPFAERALAERAGVGFIGKNHMLTNRLLGQNLLLGEIITNLELDCDSPVENQCVNCDKCIEACPTGALRADGRFDASKCISYLTIEYRDEIDNELKSKIGTSIFGCDRCVQACPFQNDAPECKNKDFSFCPEREYLEIEKVLNFTESQFKKAFGNTPILRTGLEAIKRNARICLSNLNKSNPV